MHPGRGAELRRQGIGAAGFLILAGSLGAATTPRAAAAQDLPYVFDEVVHLGASQVVPEARVVALIRERCVAFRVDADVVRRLRAAGVREEVLRAVRSACRILKGEPAKLRVEPESLVLGAGERATLVAHGVGPDGKPVESLRLEWSSADPELVSVDQAGRVTAHALGMTRVTARATNDVRASSVVWVQSRPDLNVVEPRTALLLGILVPGAGQFYTTQPVEGLVVFGGAAGSLALGLGVRDGGDRPLLLPGVLVAVGLWAYGAVDGYSAASASARRRRAVTEGGEPRWELLGLNGILFRGEQTLGVTLLSLRF